MRDLVRNPVEELRPELDYLRTVCAGLSLPDPVETHLEPLVGGWAEMTAAAAEWSSTAATLESLADDAGRAGTEPVAVAVARAHRETATSLRTAADALEHTSADAARLVADAAELLADVGRTASAVLSLPALGADAARRIVVEADERARVCAESVADLVAAMLQQWQALTATLQADPLLGQVQQQQAVVEQLHAGGISVAASTSGGAHVEVTPLEPAAPSPQPPAEPAAVVAASAAEPVSIGAGGAGAAGAGGGGASSGGYSGGGGGTSGGGSAAPAAAPLSGGSRVAAVEDTSGSRPAAAPAAPAAATAAGAGSTGRSGSSSGGMMGMGGAGAGGAGGDTERKRTTRYVADPEEVFGAPQKTAPPVIGERNP